MTPPALTSDVTPAQQYPRWKQIVLPVGVTLVVIIGLSSAVDTGAVLGILREVDPLFLGLAAMKVPFQVLFWTLRWYCIIRERRFPVRFSRMLTAVMVRSFCNNMTPGAGTGGEPVGAYYLSRRSVMNFKQAMASTASERMYQGGVFAVLMLFSFLTALPFLPLTSSLIRTLFVAVFCFIGFIALMVYLSIFQFRYGRIVLEGIIRTIARVIPSLHRRWEMEHLREHLDGWHREFRAFMARRQVILWIALFTTINWWLDLMQPYLIFRGLHVDVPFWLVVVTSTIVRVSGVFAIIPGGAGVLEGLNVGLYAGLSAVPNEAIVAETILFRALDAWILWLGSGIVTSFAVTSLTRRNPE